MPAQEDLGPAAADAASRLFRKLEAAGISRGARITPIRSERGVIVGWLYAPTGDREYVTPRSN